MNDHAWTVFFEIHTDLPREAPGDDDSTKRALSACRIPSAAAILDMGCGPGGQTVAAALQFPDAHVAAFDLHVPFLVELNRRAEAAGCGSRVSPLQTDMTRLPFADQSFDLVLAEGSAYVLGIETALAVCRDLLRSEGWFVFTELVWLTASPPPEAKTFFDNEYPAMTTSSRIARLITDAGFDVLEEFTVPDASWWGSYYTPMQQRLDMLREKYVDDDTALAVIGESQREIDIRRDYADSYGYEFFVTRLRRSGTL